MRGKHLVWAIMVGSWAAFSGVAWASEAGAHAELNWYDFTLRILNFVIMAAILYRLLKKPLANFIASRRENIQNMLTELEQKQREAEQKTLEYQGKLATLEQETSKIVAEYIEEGEIEKRKIIEAAERQADYIKQQAQLAIQQEVKSAREELQREIVELSVAAAEEILRKNIQPGDHDRLVQEFVTKAVEAK
jgi:F-type H+-transporting ATPase subunit b